MNHLVRNGELLQVAGDEFFKPIFHVALNLDAVAMELLIFDLHGGSACAELFAHLAGDVCEIAAVLLEADDRRD